MECKRGEFAFRCLTCGRIWDAEDVLSPPVLIGGYGEIGRYIGTCRYSGDGAHKHGGATEPLSELENAVWKTELAK